MFLNNQEVTEEIKKDIQKIPTNKWQQKYNNPKPMGHSKNSPKREFCSSTNLLQETRKASNKQPKLTPKKKKNSKTQS